MRALLRSFIGIVFALVGVSLVGCSESYEMKRTRSAESKGSYSPASEAAGMPESNDVDAFTADTSSESVEAELGQAGDGAPDTPEQKIQRQIIYTAFLRLIVEEFDGVPAEVEKLAARHNGFVAKSSVEGSSGSPRSGSWTIRVPVQQYGTFLEAAQTLGEFQSLTTGSEEVTAEFYDVLARIENKQRQEKRLIELLEKATGKLEEVLRVEEQLARVREEIERMQGRMRVLKDQTSFSTITLTIQEIKGYQPPAAPTFGNRIARAWFGTLTALQKAGENLVIAIVTIIPWLLILLIPLLMFIGLLRFLFRKRRTE
ncbi:DUF4349 domain-containing protein [Lignipirellula cremea]|uniref:DUF4349 domain-containing protein n=1 Tax=Lignipirellula cremea TaxID=2528010 RepID=A0A518DZ82_9BACT|nr:DUF4349 domain-containing protein [Lignipirellula cremea]QDU97143.1 hypothetical protein Pla8534_49880 [Lignipirellula cremea]